MQFIQQGEMGRQFSIFKEFSITKFSMQKWIFLQTELEKNFIDIKKQGKITLTLCQSAAHLFKGCRLICNGTYPNVVFRSRRKPQQRGFWKRAGIMSGENRSMASEFPRDGRSAEHHLRRGQVYRSDTLLLRNSDNSGKIRTSVSLWRKKTRSCTSEFYL